MQKHMYFIKYKKIFYLYFAKYTFYLIVLLPFVCITFHEIDSPLVAGRSRKIGMVVGRADTVSISDVVLLSHYNYSSKNRKFNGFAKFSKKKSHIHGACAIVTNSRLMTCYLSNKSSIVIIFCKMEVFLPETTP